ncbi:tail assembly protein [Iodobacter fluviatilis]|nr:tail assembly protein [Iodobacter fluviatilis]
MREIILYGAMRRQFGRRFFLDVANPAEAVRALMAVVPGFKVWFTKQAQAGAAYHVLVGKKDLNKDQLHDPHPDSAAIRIAPALRGAKAGVLQVVMGVILIAVSYMTFWSGPVAAGIFAAGVGMIIGGVVQMLSPQRTADAPEERPGNKPSTVFSGAVNTTAQGHPVPVLYGELIVGSAVISAGISTDDVAL